MDSVTALALHLADGQGHYRWWCYSGGRKWGRSALFRLTRLRVVARQMPGHE